MRRDTSEQHGIKPIHLVWPVLFGLAGVGYLFLTEFSAIQENSIQLYRFFDATAVGFILLALLTEALRDGAGMGRLYLLSGKKIRFAGLWRVRMLYEFTNAVTPSIAGGSTLEMLYIHKEGVKFGESTAITIISLFLDEAFMVLALPIFACLVPLHDVFAVGGGVGVAIFSIFLLAYVLKLLWVVLLFVGIFIKPEVLGGLTKIIFQLPFIRRWRWSAYRTAVEIKICSCAMRHKSWLFWGKNLLLTVGIWIGRFFVANLLIMAFSTFNGPVVGFFDQCLILARQYALMVIMILAPTPGGSGFAEVVFNTYLSSFIQPGVVMLLITSLWRIITYYSYLVVGCVLTPTWIKNKFQKKASSEAKKP